MERKQTDIPRLKAFKTQMETGYLFNTIISKHKILRISKNFTCFLMDPWFNQHLNIIQSVFIVPIKDIKRQ